ncbi:hypothetical protein EBR21_11590 [bacterium]|nr:hypothetical protein [bacterium]
MPEKLPARKLVVILGAGYVGKSLCEFLAATCDVRLATRSGNSGGKGTLSSPLCFELQRRETWSSVDSAEAVVWTFPAASTEADVALAVEFCSTLRERKISVLVLASTSCFVVANPHALVDESFELDLTQVRVRAEEALRHKGCFILALAGIYGPGRDPCSWLRRGLIKSGGNFINLIHRDDINKMVFNWIMNPVEGVRINASDGRHRLWSELLDQLKTQGMIERECNPFLVQEPQPGSKRIDNRLLLKELFAGPFHRYPEDGL